MADAKGARLGVNPTARQLLGAMGARQVGEVPNGPQGSTVTGAALAGYVSDKKPLGGDKNIEVGELFTDGKGAKGVSVVGIEVAVVVTGAVIVLAVDEAGFVGNLGGAQEIKELGEASVERDVVVDVVSPSAEVTLCWESGWKMARCCFRSCSLL